jgi:hypothetical protein
MLSIEIISTLILAPRKDIMYSMRLPQKKKNSPFSHGKPGASSYYPLGVELQLSRPVVSPFYIVVPVQDTYNHSQ